MAFLWPKFAMLAMSLTCLKLRRALSGLSGAFNIFSPALILALLLAAPASHANESAALLKLAQRLSVENLSTVEDYAQVLSFRTNEKSFLALQKEIPRLAFKDSKELALKLRGFHHYKDISRMTNLDVKMLALIAKLQGEIEFTTEEFQALQQNPKLTDYSLFLAEVSGGRGPKRKLLAAEYAELIKNSYVTASMPTFPDQTPKRVSIFKATPQLKWMEKFEEYKSFRKKFRSLSQEERILSFHRQSLPKESFGIVHKTLGQLKIYSKDGALIKTESVRTYRGDELNTGGAGIYRAAAFVDGYQFMASQKDLEIRGQLGIKEALPERLLIYVLPETSQHQFFIRDNSLVFMADRVKRQRQAYNYGLPSQQNSQISFIESMDNGFLANYLETLRLEKETIRNLMKSEDDEYNLAAELALGILAPETSNGESLKYKLKEMAPWLISILKGNGLDTNENSRGPTQIKNIPDAIEKHYQLSKQDLQQPRAAAIATVAFCLELMRDLRNIASAHPEIHEANLQEYLYYLYQGRRSEIRNATATPEKNKSIQKIFKQIKEFPLIRIKQAAVAP